ncbi:hypothetical protein AXA91_20880 [Salmonella enterica]|nr:hypothetical protein [Salmonella enterica]EBX9172117.1 hypothetical protein [Salmonella enterica subsp. enterica serovar Kandla]EBX9803035.1 hypothetical protein [Salmonella enterica subsp. enterica serovar Kandla]EBY1903375.1 hypothetical protein [Salmonella enterica subsp. enterica serovar Kandla]
MGITVTNWFGQITAVTGIQPVHNAVVMGKGAPLFSAALLDKLKPQNSAGLGSVSVQGNVLNTRTGTMPVLDVANTYLTNKLTADELALILRNRDKFTFTIGVGDRRAEFKSRFRIATNWHGGDADNLLLAPDPWNDPRYNFRLTFTGSAGTMKLTDTHASPDTYGSIRYFTIREK